MIFFVILLILISFLAFRNKRIICPSNVVFGNYFLYLVFPATLFYFLEWISWEYVLPWGKMNDWAGVSQEAILAYLYVFTLFFYLTRGLELLIDRAEQPDVTREHRARPAALWVCALLLLLGCAYFFQVTGGLDAWTSDYSETYLSKKKGYGLLNFFLIMWANFLAFWVGFYCRTAQRRSLLLLLFVLLVLACCAFVQGVKSRIFMFGIFFSLPWLAVARLSLKQGVCLFLGFMVLFSGAMYVRSNGFYNTPEMLLEYFLTYFNTIFLHDMILQDMQPDYFLTMGYPINKWLSLIGVSSPDYLHDISRWLTAMYFPSQWFDESATQQWPIETELYLNYGSYVFWVVPIALYAVFICTLYALRFRGGPVFLFICMSELFMFLSMFRGSMLQWIILFNVLFYLMLMLGQRLMFARVKPLPKAGEQAVETVENGQGAA